MAKLEKSNALILMWSWFLLLERLFYPFSIFPYRCLSIVKFCEYMGSWLIILIKKDKFQNHSSSVVVILMPLDEGVGLNLTWWLSLKSKLISIKGDEQFTMKCERIKDLKTGT